jgi:hypothetical protein
MPLVPHLVVRVSDTPPPAADGPMLGRLIAQQRHAALTRWVTGEQVLSGGLNELEQWKNGAGPDGRRIGLVFGDGDSVFVGHDAPGEISPTVGLGLADVATWVSAVTRAIASGREPLDIQGERYDVRVKDGIIEVRALDWDGVIEAAASEALGPFLDGLEVAAITAANLAAVAAVAGSPLPGAETLREAARALVDTNEDLDD